LLAGVAVEKLDLSKRVEKTWREENLPTTFLVPGNFLSPEILIARALPDFVTQVSHGNCSGSAGLRQVDFLKTFGHCTTIWC
jgi:hypothetical protein